jgi:DNA-binding beta-propeller fold protein YncE
MGHRCDEQWETGLCDKLADGTVTVFWASNGHLLAQIPVGRAHYSVIVSPDGRNAFVSDFDSHGVVEIRLRWPHSR